ncbi:MAG: LysM peptidoglycan-binding domain-containing protein, partial [Methylobacterium sp.]
MTTGRLRHGIVLALAGLVAGLGIVLGLYGTGGLSRIEQAAQGKLSALSPNAAGPGKDADKPAQETPPQDKPAQDKSAQDKSAQDKPAQDKVPGAEPGKAAEAAIAPSFDIVRVEPNGDTVVAGRGRPNTVIEMLVDGKPVAKALTDPNGQFAIVPPALPKGSSEIMLRSRTADGQEVRSPQSVAVSVAPEGKSRPLVALSTPDAPTVVLSQPGTPETAQAGRVDKPAGGGGTNPTGRPIQDAATRIVSVDAEPGGRLFVTGTGKPGTDVRLYLNDTLIAPARIGPDGRVTFTIGRGVAQGQYQVRIDEIDPKSGRVLHRAEVPFAMPQQVAEAARADHGQMDHGKGDHAKPEQKPVSALRGEPMAATPPSSPSSRSFPAAPPAANGLAGAPEDPAASGAVFVPSIATARITRGDNLWQISKRIYGRGERYTVIYDANQGQIRDPDLIYPGQIFVLP